jgi:hypothetical protein
VLVYVAWNYPMNRWFVFRKRGANRAARAGTSTPAA